MTLIDGKLATAFMVVLICKFDDLDFQQLKKTTHPRQPAFFQVLGQAMLIAVGSSYMALSIPIVLVFIYMIQSVYLRTSRQLRFLDIEARSPLYSHFLSTLEGIVTIRAFGWEREADEKNRTLLDQSQKPYYLLYCIQRWLNLVLDLLVAGLAVVVVTLAIELRSSESQIGIALSSVLSFNQVLSTLITHWTMLETSLGAVSRVKSFAGSTPSERRPEDGFSPPPNWPEFGKVEFRDVTASHG